MYRRRGPGQAQVWQVGGAAMAAVLAVGLSACSGSSGGGSAGSGSSGAHRGGTLTLVGDGDVDHLDTSSIYSGVTYTIERAFTRQLVTYPATGRTSMPSDLVPDIATQVPSTTNGGITDGGRTYTFKIKPGSSRAPALLARSRPPTLSAGSSSCATRSAPLGRPAITRARLSASLPTARSSSRSRRRPPRSSHSWTATTLPASWRLGT